MSYSWGTILDYLGAPGIGEYGTTIANKRPFYADAFENESFIIWKETEFKHQIVDIAHKRTMSCFLRNNPEAEYDRRELLYAMLKPVFSHDDKEDTLIKYYSILPTDNLYIRRIIRNLCIIYNEAPDREINGEAQNEFINLLNDRYLNNTLQKTYRVAKLTGECIVRPYINNGLLKWSYFLPDVYRVKEDRYGNPEEIWIAFEEFEDAKPVIKFHVWTADEYSVRNAKGKPIKFTDPDGKEAILIKHGYGGLPFERLEMDENENLYDLVRAQLECNALDLYNLQNITFNAFSVWVLTSFPELGKNFKLSPNRVITAKAEHPEAPVPEVSTVAPTAFFSEIDEYKQDKMKRVMKNLGLPTSLVDDNPGLAQSGVAMKMDRKELDEIRREDIYVLEDFESRLINATARILNYDNRSNEKLKPKYPVEISITYQEPELFTEPRDFFDLEIERWNNDLKTPKQLVNDIAGKYVETDEEAIEFIKQNREFKKLISGDDNDEGRELQPADEKTAGNADAGYDEDADEKDSSVGGGNVDPEKKISIKKENE